MWLLKLYYFFVLVVHIVTYRPHCLEIANIPDIPTQLRASVCGCEAVKCDLTD